MPTISERILTLELKKMEERKLIIRTVYAEEPVRVEYELTESGRELVPIIRQLEEWGRRHRGRG
jgi:DNA-binding HxlR family transcriptional regulator